MEPVNKRMTLTISLS